MLFVTVISPTQQYLLENSLSTRRTVDFVASFSIQTVEGSSYYGIETPLPHMRNLTTRLYLVV